MIRTDEWLEKDFRDPKKICIKLLDYFKGETDPMEIYDYLSNFGMYKPSRRSWIAAENLKEERFWEKTEEVYKKYKKKWNGPEIPIFIFPMNESNMSLMREGKGKSGVSFIDKMFLFLTPLTDLKELEALFVHEYHHICRMNSLKKNPAEYTLLDSIILEGLAEHAVAQNCGETYTGEWTRKYSAANLRRYWNREVSEKLSITRDDRQHDQILFGFGGRPKLLGYALGYEIVKRYIEHENLTERTSLRIPSDQFTKNLDF